MYKIKRYLIFTISILLIHSCKVYTDSGFNTEMERYSNYCLSYPNSCEEYLRKVYQVDCLNSYDFLHATEDYVGLPISSNEEDYNGDVIKYNDYNHIMDSIFTIEEIRNEADPLLCFIKRDWHYMFQNKDHIKIVHKRKKIMMINTKSGERYKTDNIINLEKKFLKNYGKGKYEYHRFITLNFFSRAKLYTKDTLQIFPPWESEYDSIQIKISKLLSKNSTSLRSNRKSAHILHYNRNGELTDFYGKDVPEDIVENKELFEYLNSIFKAFPQVHIIHFRANPNKERNKIRLI